MQKKVKLAVVIPCYKVRDHILAVINGIGAEVARIYVVDDGCPQNTGTFVEQHVEDKRVRVVFNEENKGVGGATLKGYQTALEEQMDIVVKLDGDGQMNPALITGLIKPILSGRADYCKGNRFYSSEHIAAMPFLRLFGNAILSFFTKGSSGYWNVFDPTNGFTAIHSAALRLLPLDKINKGYFFESDMLFRLNTIRAVVVDVPMRAFYGEEESNMKPLKMVFPFLAGHARNLTKRIVYNYFLRDMNVASFEIFFGLIFLVFGILYGGLNWLSYAGAGTLAPGGVIMLAAMTVIVGVQLLLSAINYDVQHVPKVPIQQFEESFFYED